MPLTDDNYPSLVLFDGFNYFGDTVRKLVAGKTFPSDVNRWLAREPFGDSLPHVCPVKIL